MAEEQRQVVRFIFLELDPTWRRLPVATQADQQREFAAAVRGFRAKMLLRTYSLVGTRGDADLMFWQAAPDLETLQQFETTLFSTRLGAYLGISQSYLAMTRRSAYEFPDDPDAELRTTIRPGDNRYLFVYPFVKTREWYRLPHERRQAMMTEHVRIGRQYPGVRVNTTYSFGLDDQEFVVTFESDSPGPFVDLVMELRGSEASAYTERDTPVFTCLHMSVWDALDALGGARAAGAPDPRDANGFIHVADVDDLPPGSARRVYVEDEAVALFNVDGDYYAVSDRCSHARASLSEGSVDPAGCVLTCPWHDGRFDLRSGQPIGGPPRVAVTTFVVRRDESRILVGRKVEGRAVAPAPVHDG